MIKNDRELIFNIYIGFPLTMRTNKQKNIALENEIVSLLKQGDKRAITLLYKNYSGALFGIISRTISNKEVAKEVLQDVFVKVWNNSDKYDSKKGKLFTWLAQIARNSTIDTLRSGKYQRGTKTDVLDVVVTNNNSNLSESMKIEDSGLQTVIKELDEKYRILIEHIYFKGYSQSEAAEHLDIPLGTVKTRMRAAILSLRKSLGNELLTLGSALVLLLSYYLLS